MLLITGSQMLFVNPGAQTVHWIHVIIDCIAGLLFIGGIIAFIDHWFPDPSRKFSWQRKHKESKRLTRGIIATNFGLVRRIVPNKNIPKCGAVNCSIAT